MILSCVLGVMTLGVGYAYLSPEVYRAEVRLLPPSTASLSGLKGVIELTPSVAFSLTNSMLDSVGIKNKLISFCQEKGFTESPEKNFLHVLKLTFPNGQKNRNYTEVAIEWYEPNQAALILNKWVELALMAARKQLVEDAESVIDEQIENAKNKISAKERLALEQIKGEVIQLREAKEIADQNGLVDPIDVSTRLVTGNQAYANVMELRSLYLMGSKALSAEIMVLERRSEEPQSYVPGIAQLKEQIERLQGVNIEQGAVETGIVDSWATPPESWIAPKRAGIIIASAIFGALLGLACALVSISMDKVGFLTGAKGS